MDSFTCADGTRLRVVEDGDPAAPITVVLVHCYALDHREWAPMLPELLAAFGSPVRVLRYDQRGSGESGEVTPSTATIARLGDDLAELIADRAPSGPVVLVGHSLGGMAVMALAERHQELFAERVAGVAFVSTACNGLGTMSLGLPAPVASVVHRFERAGVWLLSALRLPVITHFPKALEPFVRWLVFGEDPARGDVAHVARLVAACRPLTMLLFRPDFGTHDRREALSTIAGSPAASASAVLVGDRDRITPPRCAAEIAEWLPGARFVLLEGAGHMLPHERPGAVAATVATLVRAALDARAVA